MEAVRPDAKKWTREEYIVLAVILALGFLLRMRHLDTLMPWFIHFDELRTTEVAIHLLRDRTLDPQHSLYPACAFYMNAIGFALWAAAGQVMNILHNGPHVISDFFYTMEPGDDATIMLSRWVSIAFSMGSIVFAHLFFRRMLSPRFALVATFLFTINSLNVSMSGLGKIDAINLFWLVAGYYFFAAYLQEGGGLRWVIPCAILAAFSTVTKNNYHLVILIGLCVFPVQLKRHNTFGGFFREQFNYYLSLPRLIRKNGLITTVKRPEFEPAAFIAVTTLAAFIASPYSFIRLKETLVSVGWVYAQSETISTYHTDPHVWWLDRYQYILSVVFPFIFGLPLFAVLVPSMFRYLRGLNAERIVFYISFVWWTYVFASQSGGPKGGSFPYYLYLNMVPFGILIAVDWMEHLDASMSSFKRFAAKAVLILLAISSLVRLDSFHDMFFGAYDRLGPVLEHELKPGEKALMVSVFNPSPIFHGKLESVWPQFFNQELIDARQPDIIVIDSWLIAGFRKVYRDLWVAPLVDGLLSGNDGYEVIATIPSNYFGEKFFAAIDPEHDVEIYVLRKIAPEKKP